MMRSRKERGATTVTIAIMLVMLIAGVGVGIDFTKFQLERVRVQNAADESALAVGGELAKGGLVGPNTASTLTTGNAGAGAVPTVHPQIGDSVKVDVEKNVDYNFLRVLGFKDRVIRGSATSTWGNAPTEGYPVLPLGVSYCTWKNNSQLAGTPAETSNKIPIRTDTLQSVRNLLSGLTGISRSVVDLNGLLSALGTNATDTCTDGSESIVTLKGGVWLTSEHVISSTLSGLFGYPTGSCNLRVGNDLSTFLGGVEGFAFLPAGCAAKFGPGNPVDVGKTILLPVYKPSTTSKTTLGLKASACVGVLSSSRSCVDVPPQIGARIVGYAPFKITGWKYPYPSTPAANDASVPCADTNLSFNLFNVVNGLLNVVERIVNAILLSGLGNLTTSLSCNGLQGYFTKSFTTDPNFQYGPDGLDLGATNLRLSE